MFSFIKKIAIAASLMALYSGQFVVFASDYERQTMELGSPSVQRHALTNTLAPAKYNGKGVVQTAFFPHLSGRDLKGYLVRFMCEESSPFRLAKVCKAWYQFVMGRDVIVKKRQPILVDPFSKSSTLIQEIMNRWRAQKDLQILRNGTFRYQPEGEVAIGGPFAAMFLADTIDEVDLPANVAQYMCVTRNIKTFVEPDGDNTRKTLVLLLTLSELKGLAQQISSDALFLQNVSCADLSRNAVCALIRQGNDDLEEWGFRYTILKFGEMNNRSILNIYTHKKVGLCVSGGGPYVAAVARHACFRFDS